MDYREIPPPAHLDRWVECLWSLSGPATPEEDGADGIAPDGRVELVFHFGDPFRRSVSGGSRKVTQHRAAVVGAFTAPMVIEPTGAVGVFGVRLKRGAAEAVLREDASRIVGESVDLEDLWGSSGRALVEGVCGATGDTARVAVVVAALEARLFRGTGAEARVRGDASVDAAFSLLERSGGRAEVSSLAEAAGVSPRTLERRFLARAGLPPKVLSRLVRFQEVLRRLPDATRWGWAAVAHDCGYADQSHLVRDFREFTGSPPSGYVAEDHPIASRFYA